MASQSKIVYLVRHATPDWSRTDLAYHRQPGPPLTGHGEAEAQELGEFFEQAGVGQVFASPMERCRHTAEIAASVTGLPLEIIPAIDEWQPGETGAQIIARFWPVFEKALEEGATGGPVAIVTHGGPIAYLLAELGLDEAEIERLKRIYDHHNPLPPAGVWQATCAGEAWELEMVFTPNGKQQAA